MRRRSRSVAWPSSPARQDHRPEQGPRPRRSPEPCRQQRHGLDHAAVGGLVVLRAGLQRLGRTSSTTSSPTALAAAASAPSSDCDRSASPADATKPDITSVSPAPARSVNAPSSATSCAPADNADGITLKDPAIAQTAPQLSPPPPPAPPPRDSNQSVTLRHPLTGQRIPTGCPSHSCQPFQQP
jgi:hypothetical protein